MPLPVIAFGFINNFVDGSLGLLSSLLCLFINGIVVSISGIMERGLHSINRFFQVEMAFGPCAAYLVDVMHSRRAESLATHVFERKLVLRSTSIKSCKLFRGYIFVADR